MMLDKKIIEWKVEFLRYCENRKLAESTKIVYWGAIECFVWHFNTISLGSIRWQQIADYIGKYDSARTKEQKKYAIQLFYSVCIGQDNKCEHIPSPIREQQIPEVLNIDECHRAFLALDNPKQRIAIKFTYHCALRISEVRNGKIKQLDFTAGFFSVKSSKGNKDRQIPIPPDVRDELIEYLNNRFPNGYSGEEYIFAGQNNFKGIKKEQYSFTSLRNIFKKACKKAGILKKLKFHSLRHSMATHWHNSGVLTLRDIADLLGHISTKTTEIYLHTQNEDLRDKTLLAGEIIKSKRTSIMMQQIQNKIIKPETIKVIPSPSEKLYQILLKGKTYILKERNNKICDAPEGARWSIGVLSKKALEWFQSKGATINQLQTT